MYSKASIFARSCQIAVAFLLFVTLSVSSYLAPAQAEDLTFSWRANPVEELISGYRLYYGPESRYKPLSVFSQKSGFNEPLSFSSPKKGFSYEYFIDLALELRCPADSCSYDDCEQLTPGTVSCQEVFGAENSEYLRCTVLDLPGQSYFTLTAYNDYGEESDYSDQVTDIDPEIFIGNISSSPTEFGWTALLGLALSIPPTDDVTIILSSEGTSGWGIFPPSIILNADNLIQFVHVIWFDSTGVEGTSEYKIITTPAESMDLNYAGIDPDDFVIVN